jgi:hypothetical protein
VLSKLAAAVAERLEHLGNRDVLGVEANSESGRPTLVRPVRRPHGPVVNEARAVVARLPGHI